MLPLVVGHRGAAAHAPENTIEGIRLAADQGITAVEVDVTLTRDGVPVLLHDARLDRTTDGTGPVAARTAAEIERLDAGSWFDSRYAGARIPRLADVIGLCAERNLAANLELKPASGQEKRLAAATIDAVRRACPTPGPAVIISSFTMAALAAARHCAVEVPRAALFDRGRLSTWIATAAELGCIAVHARYDRLTPGRIAKLKAAGLRCGAYTVNKETTAQRLIAMGVDYLFSDRPAEILASLTD